MAQEHLKPPAPIPTGELPELDESDECTEVFHGSMLSFDDKTSPLIPAFPLPVPEAPPTTPPTTPVLSNITTLPDLAPLSALTALAPPPVEPSVLPPPRPPVKPLPALDFDDVTGVLPAKAAEDDLLPIPLQRRKSNPPPAASPSLTPPPPTVAASSASTTARRQAQAAQKTLFQRLLALLWN
jgi:hypothetical protein